MICIKLSKLPMPWITPTFAMLHVYNQRCWYVYVKRVIIIEAVGTRTQLVIAELLRSPSVVILTHWLAPSF